MLHHPARGDDEEVADWLLHRSSAHRVNASLVWHGVRDEGEHAVV